MDESRRLAMRRAHARREYCCTCGKTVHGNGGYKMHGAMHKRRADGHRFIVPSERERRVRSMTDDVLKALEWPEARDERTRRLISLDGDIGRRHPRI